MLGSPHPSYAVSLTMSDTGNESDTVHGHTRCGYVTLMGAPNAGKSTLMNALVGEQLSIVTAKAQTTWARVTGILTEEDSQIVFLDTPGILEPRDLLHRSLLITANQALEDADLLVMVVDGAELPGEAERARLMGYRERSRAPLIVALNKTDRMAAERVREGVDWAEQRLGATVVHPVSALTGEGIPDLLAAIRARLPEGPFLYPEDEIAAEPVRFFAAELVRETILELFQDEVPYSVFCQVEEFREGGERTYIQVNVYVERPSQKGILIGEGGRAIRELGIAARRKLEHFLGGPVYLDLWVKVLPKWRKKRAELRRLGLPVPTETKPSP